MHLVLTKLAFLGLTSPANPKMGLRMTTLHEETAPLPRKHSLDLIRDEDIEDDDSGNQEAGAKPEYTVNIPWGMFLRTLKKWFLFVGVG